MRRTLFSALAFLLGSMCALAADTIVFGAAISITGKTAKEGEYTRDGYQFAIDKINEMGGIKVGGKTYQVALKYYDDETKPERSAQLFEKLINEDKVNLLLGPYGSSPTGTAAPIAERYKIPMVEANGSAESIFSKGYKFTFMILSPAKGYLRGIIDAVRAKDPNAKTVAILGENESFSKEVAGGAAEYAKEKGMNIVYDELYPANAQDVSALLTAIKGKNPDLILGSGHLQDSLLIVKQSKDLGVSPKAMGFSVGPSSPEFRANLGKSADYIFGATAKHPSYKTVPYQVAESAVAVIAYQKAIERAGTIEPTKVRDALAALDIMTFYGKVKFDARGVNIYKPMAVEQYQPDGNKYTVWPQEVAEKAPLYPMPAWDKR